MISNQLWFQLIFIAIAINLTNLLSVDCATDYTKTINQPTDNHRYFRNVFANDSERLIKIEDYIEWILNNFPKSKTNKSGADRIPPHMMIKPTANNANVVNCLDLAIDFTQDNTKQRIIENQFVDVFLRKISTKYQQTFRYETIFKRIYPEPYFCEFFIVIGLNHKDLMKSIRLWNVTKKSRFLIVIWASDILGEGRQFDDEIMDIHQWKTSLFTHTEMVVILNRKMYKLNTPFQRAERSFEEITVEQFKTWDLFDIENVAEFGGKHLKISTIDCPPQSYWRYDNTTRKLFMPQPGDSEIMCQDKPYMPRWWKTNCSK